MPAHRPSAFVWIPLASLLVSLACPMPLPADTFVYVSMAPEEKIQVYRLDADAAPLAPVEALAVEGTPGSLAVDPDRKFLFASLRSTSKLASFRIDHETGKLSPVGTAALNRRANAAYVGTDRTGRWLLSASYAGGNVVVHRLADDGKIETPAVQSVNTAQSAHCIVTDRENRFAFVPHVMPNAVYQFRFDAATGRLTDAGRAPGGAENAGPRHLVFHPTKNVAYTSNETGSSVTAYGFDPDTGLKPLQTLSTLPADFDGDNTTADVKVHPNGRFVWVSNRGHDSLAGFAIDENGRLSPVGHTPTERTPRSFDIAPGGRFAFGAGEGSGKLALFRLDPAKGTLARVRTYDVGRSLTWVLAVECDANDEPRE